MVIPAAITLRLHLQPNNRADSQGDFWKITTLRQRPGGPGGRRGTRRACRLGTCFCPHELPPALLPSPHTVFGASSQGAGAKHTPGNRGGAFAAPGVAAGGAGSSGELSSSRAPAASDGATRGFWCGKRTDGSHGESGQSRAARGRT